MARCFQNVSTLGSRSTYRRPRSREADGDAFSSGRVTQGHLQSQRAYDLRERIERGIPLLVERAIKPFAGKSGALRQLAHPEPRATDVAERCRNESGILVRDDEEQAERAEKLIRRSANAGDPVSTSLLVLLATEWILRSRYKLNKAEILGTFSELLSSMDLSFEDEPSIEEALFLWKDSPAQFADCLIGARHRALGCDAMATFDSDAVKLPGWVSV
jgi:predicted nucleic-acid-binding protein